MTKLLWAVTATAVVAMLAGSQPADAELRVTPAGTPYEFTTVYPLAGGRAIEIMRPVAANGLGVEFLHGNGGTLINEVAAMRPLYEAWVDRGWTVYSPASRAGWGNDASLDLIRDAWTYMAATYGLTDQVIYGQSMGGLAGLDTVLLRPTVPARAWAGNSPATNLRYQYDHRSDERKQINNAYSITASNPYAAATAGHDPQLHAAADFSRTSFFRFYASYGDGTVTRANNTDLMAAKLAGGGLAAEAAVVTCTGSHLNGTCYQAGDVTAFYERAFA